MKSTFVSHFTPSLMSPEALEAILVQRHQLAKDLETGIRESVLTDKKCFYLLLGTRGIGKTHLVALTYHRIAKMEDLRDKLVIAWLREEEWGVTSFLDLLLRIFRALQGEYPQEYATELDEKVEALYQLSASEAEIVAADILREFVGEKTLLLLTENLDDLFDGLGEVGQKRFREYIQKYGFFTILATAQSMFDGVLQNDAPFYEFFQVHQLEELTLEQARQLLRNIARQEEKKDLEEFILTPTGRDRISAINHLAAGNPRVYVIFSQFLTRTSLDELVEPFMKMLDDLTPYYQARMSWLSQQQRKIIEFLTESRHAVSVKEIAQRCFASHQTASSQLKDLRGKGYVRSETIGRESFYELREPLMRICLEVKKQRGEIIQLFVNFLRIWYTKQELEQRLKILPPDAKVEQAYILYTLQTIEQEANDTELKKHFKQFSKYLLRQDKFNALQIVEKFIENLLSVEDWFIACLMFYFLKQYEQALAYCNKAIELDSNTLLLWWTRGIILYEMGKYEEALISLKKEIKFEIHYMVIWSLLGLTYRKLERYHEALESFDKVIELGGNDQQIWMFKGVTLIDLECYEEALHSLNKAIELKGNKEIICYYYISIALVGLEKFKDALMWCNKLIEIEPNESINWENKALMLFNLQRYEEALTSLNKAIELDSNNAEAWYHKSDVLINLDMYEEALGALNKTVELNSDNAVAWHQKGWVLIQLERYDEALICLNQAMELGYKSHTFLFLTAQCLIYLQRWEEAIIVLENSLSILGDEEQLDTEYTGFLIYSLFKLSNNIDRWKKCIINFIDIFTKHKLISALGTGLINHIPDLMEDTYSDESLQNWLEVWQELAGNIPEFQIPLKLLDTAVRYRLSKGDRRVLLELPIEERKILQQVLELEES